MSRQWVECTLGDVLAELKNGLNCKQDKSGRGDRISRIESVSDGTFDDARVGFAILTDAEKQRYRLKRDDILFSHINSPPHVGKIAIFESDTPVFHGVNLLLLRPLKEVDPKFLFYFLVRLRASGYWEENCKKSVNQASVNQKDIAKVAFRYPRSLEEQQRIVVVLDEAFAAIATATANAEKNIANARELFEAAFRQRFDHVGNGWQIYNLPEIGENWDYLRRPVTKSDRVPGDVPYYGASGQVDSVRDHLFDDDLLLISEDGANLLMRTYPIAFSISGKSWVNNHAHILKFDDMATQRLVEYYLNSISLAPWVSGMAQPKLNQKALNSIPVPLPPKSERAKLVGELDDLADRIERLEENQKQKLATLAGLKQSLLHRAFTGGLTAATPNLALA